MYTDTNYKTKKALKEDLSQGKEITVYQPNAYSYPAQRDGTVTIEGPHYPQPHKWYASCQIRNGVIIAGTLK